MPAAYKLRRAVPEDAGGVVRAAFSDPPTLIRGMHGLPNDGVLPEKLMKDEMKRYLAEMEDPDTILTVAIPKDSDSGGDPHQVVGFAKWRIVNSDSMQGKAAADSSENSDGTEVNALLDAERQKDLQRWFKLRLEKGRRDHLAGQPYVRLSNLFVVPAHQRRGIASSLISRGLSDLADHRGLPVYVEATPDGVAVYEKHGFVAVESFEIDLGQFIQRTDLELGNPTWVHTLMLRARPCPGRG